MVLVFSTFNMFSTQKEICVSLCAAEGAAAWHGSEKSTRLGM
jgi:hypothetical protein